MLISRRECLLGAAVVAANGNAIAQVDYPRGPIRIIGGFPAGGIPDTLGRLLGDRFVKAWGKPVTVEMITGAGGNLAGDRVAKSQPNGQTLLMAASGQIVINPSIYDRMSSDPVRDLAPITKGVVAPNVLVVNNEMPARSVGELIALARARPGELTFGSAGLGTPAHLAGELFKHETGIDMRHIPYRGIPPLLPDLLEGRISMAFPPLITVLALIGEGKLRALAMTTAKRSEALPELPTMSESGVPGFDAAAWFGLLAPSGTPVAVINQLHAETVKTFLSNDIRGSLTGLDVVANSPAEFAEEIAAETAKWAKVVQAINLRAE